MLKTVPHAIIGNRYDLQRELARGGMGSVWVAKDTKLKRQVAVKVMVPMWVNAADAIQRFEREAMAVAQLQSPHVVQIFDYGVEQQCPYIVMELLEGEDLRERLQRQERIDLETAARIMIHASKALSAAHAAGIIHRDLKPGNIFLVRASGEELVKVLDFGVAKVDARLDADGDEPTRAGTLLGTPQYMSPEQARGSPDIDHRADLWSLAVILYRGLTGQLPFIGKSAADVIVRICTKTAPRPSEIAPELSVEVDRFFERALSRSPDGRFENARQMAVAFSRVAPTTFPSLTLPGTSLEAADAHLQRVQAAAGAEAASIPGLRPSERSGAGAYPGAGPPAGMLAESCSSVVTGGSAARGGDVPLGGGAVVTDAIGPGPSYGPADTGQAADSSSSISLAGPVGAPSSSSTLASGLVDPSTAVPPRRHRGPIVAALIAMAAVLGLVVVVATGTFAPPSDEERLGANSAASAPVQGGAPSGSSTSPEPSAGAGAQGAVAAGSAGAAPEGTTGATAEPAETAAPKRPRPVRRPRPRPRPRPQEPDPFSERL